MKLNLQNMIKNILNPKKQNEDFIKELSLSRNVKKL